MSELSLGDWVDAGGCVAVRCAQCGRESSMDVGELAQRLVGSGRVSESDEGGSVARWLRCRECGARRAEVQFRQAVRKRGFVGGLV